MNFYTAKELLEICKEQNKTIAQIMIEREISEFGVSKEEILDRMKKTFDIMRNSCYVAIKEPKNSIGGLLGGEAKKVYENKLCLNLCGDFVSKAIIYALSVMEVNASMGLIVAAPTAGSAGVVPSALVALYDAMDIGEEKVINALFTASAIGYLAMQNASVSGAEAGCQAEVGIASAMASAALVSILDEEESPQKILDAASICIANLLGLVCDPIAGLVESPCQSRNVIGVMNAISTSQLILSGIRAFIPFDEMLESMYKVGKALPFELRETALGGCASTKTACAKCKEIFS